MLSTGLLSHLMNEHRNARVTLAAGPAAASLFRAMPGLDDLIVLEKRAFGAHWLGLWRHCLLRRWDLVVDLRRSAIAYLLVTRQRRVLPKSDGPLHRVALLAATFGMRDNPPAPVLWTSRADRSRAAELIPDGTSALAIAPAANWRGKQWRADRFAELAQNLTAEDGILPGGRVAIIAAENERSQAAPVLAALPEGRRIDLVGAGDLTAIAACLGRCGMFVGNDSGLMHMAAACGIPTLGLFGPSRQEHYAPWGPRTAWVRTPESFETLTGADDYDHRTTDTMMDGLDVGTVVTAARDLWHRCGREAA